MYYPTVFAFTCIIGFLVTFGIGANDLANSFGTVYGSRVLGLKQLVVIAAVCEISGAMLMGGEVADTIKKGIADQDAFKCCPQQFMYGMMCALISCASWLFLATWKKLPVSTTHSIIGGVIGFALVWGGFKEGVVWAKTKDKFPYVGGVTPVFISWIASPALAMATAGTIFATLRCTVLRHKLDYRSIVFFAMISYLTMFGNIFFIITKGFKHRVKMSRGKALWISSLVALPFAVAGALVVTWLVRKEMKRMAEEEVAAKREPMEGDTEMADKAVVEVEETQGEQKEEEVAAKREPMEGDTEMADKAVVEVEETQGEQKEEEEGNGFVMEEFDPAVENVFRYLQIATAIIVAFAHGANDVSNGVGAVAAVYHLAANDGKFPEEGKATVPLWLLASGGVGIAIGLALWGKNILQVLGRDLVKLTASRGFCAEFAAGLTVTFASVIGIPVSTTHCITGAVLGVGLVDDCRRGVDWKLAAKVALGWIVTVVFTACTSALVYLPFFYAGGREGKNL